ncbi:MAG: (2Fe-2S)-binding protein [Actinomycetota bacterium]|nr:(2Fe-2S)-binding protein [Actinomycetota bacterium]
MPQAVVPVGESPAVVQPPAAHPLAASVVTADRAVKLLSFRIFDRMTDLAGDGWIRCDHALSDPDFFLRWRMQVAQRLAGQQLHALESTQVPAKTTGGYVLQWYLVIPSYLGAVLFHCARRVPSLSPRQLSFRLDPAKVAEVALHPGRFWCLPDDPDAGHPDAVPVPDEAALGAILRRQVIAHAAHFLTVYGPMVRFGSRTQWAAVTDVLDSALLLAGRSFGSPQAGAADARLVLADGEKPLTSASTIRELTDHRGRTHWTRLRGSCCFLYALPGVERPCASCPRINDSERACIFGTLDRA